TITLVAVFVPVSFLTGTVGRLFSEFGLSVAVAVLISGFVALTLTPMLSSRILKSSHDQSQGTLARNIDRFLDYVNSQFSKSLRWFLAHRGVALAAAALLLLLIGGLFMILPRELVPTE